MTVPQPSPTPPVTWAYENLLALDVGFRTKAQALVKARLPNYSEDHCAKLLGGSPYEYSSRCVLNEEQELIGVMAFSVGQLGTVEIVAFVSAADGIGIGRCLMDHFVHEMKESSKSAILTYIEPSAFPFFSRFGFTKQVPARSLYERITSKYVRSYFMYKDILEPVEKAQRKKVLAGDRLLVMVDGTMVPRQALVKETDSETAKVFIHYYYWSNRHDEWIFPHSPRVRWDLPLPPEPPKNQGENLPTTHQVKQLMQVELKKEKRLEIVQTNGTWPKGIKKNGPVQVRIDGNWIDAKVLEKNDQFLYCQFEHRGTPWMQDFPREAVRLGEGHESILDELLQRKGLVVKKRKETKISSIAVVKKPKTRRRKKTDKIEIELSPARNSQYDGPSDRALRKRKRESVPNRADDAQTSASSQDVEGICSVCKSKRADQPLLLCDRCRCGCHVACNLVAKDLLANLWMCDLCTQRIINRKIDPPCICCGLKSDGGAMKQTSDFKWIHVRCALLAGLEFHVSSRQFGSFRSITSPSKYKYSGQVCGSCGLSGGSMTECSHEGCEKIVHVAQCSADWQVTRDTIRCTSHRGN